MYVSLITNYKSLWHYILNVQTLLINNEIVIKMKYYCPQLYWIIFILLVTVLQITNYQGDQVHF